MYRVWRGINSGVPTRSQRGTKVNKKERGVEGEGKHTISRILNGGDAVVVKLKKISDMKSGGERKAEKERISRAMESFAGLQDKSLGLEELVVFV